MVSISAASNKTNKFQPVSFDKAADDVQIGLKNDPIEFNNNGRWDDSEGVDDLRDCRAFRYGLRLTINYDYHTTGFILKETPQPDRNAMTYLLY
jgi:hypothetical protein